MSPVLTDAQRICKCTPKNCVEPTTRRETDPLRLPVCSTIPLNSTYHSLNSRRRQDFQAFFLRSETVCPHEPERFSSISGSIRTADICANIEKRPKNALSRLRQPTSQQVERISTRCASKGSFFQFPAFLSLTDVSGDENSAFQKAFKASWPDGTESRLLPGSSRRSRQMKRGNECPMD